MSKLRNLEPIVEEVLIHNPDARKDDFILIEGVVSHFIDTDMSFKSIMLNHTDLKIPSIESITRCRRKIQELRPELCDPDIVEVRLEETGEYIQYALNLV